MPEISEIARTGIAAALFAAVFLFTTPLRPVQRMGGDFRSIVSLGAGMSSAYVFVHVMPELHGARVVVAESTQAARFEGMATYFLALLGFLAFYALEHLAKRARSTDGAGPQPRGAPVPRASPADEDLEGEPGETPFRLHVGGFAVYVWLMSYLLVRHFEETAVSTLLFAVAIAFHFMSVDHSLRTEYGEAYARRGRLVLAAMAPLGWGTGLLVGFTPFTLALMVAFISGAVIVNSAVMELSDEKDGRLLPFLAGGLVYGAILLPLA